ncbi:MAG: hypothetical protein Edafosvirus1_115 [Edafosvirus sp.]|uniref:Leucine-rich repeat protein n=1 Tax=Edafosvirus sp. TaxID=2487765 RepID=A0A3G4ZTZ0_9VIRU|nr:MAG: hypothetical protein Edafosvirus1_115 [Edafosvirus sp.]
MTTKSTEDDDYINEAKWICPLDENDPLPKYEMSYYSHDMSKLYLYWIHTQNYEKFFNEMDKIFEIFKNVTDLTIEYNVINELPSNIHEFKNLLKLTLMGTRWWSFDMHQVPVSVEELSVIHQSNLKIECIDGMHKLVNLKVLQLDIYTFTEYLFDNPKYDESVIIPFDFLSNLKRIEFILDSDDLKDIIKWKEKGLDNPFYTKIKNNIEKIDYSDKAIVIHLKNIESE